VLRRLSLEMRMVPANRFRLKASPGDNGCQSAPALHHLIRYYYQVETHLAGSTAVQPVPARSPQAMEFTFGAPYEVRRLDRSGTRIAHPIALIGSQTFRRVELLMRGNVDAFTIVFQPGGVSTYSPCPLRN
jgi:hypothetical protein